MAEFKVEQQGALEVWTIEGEGRRNTLRRAMLDELEALVARVSAGRETRAVVLTGAGEKAFCAGADLKERVSMTEPDIRTFLTQLRHTFRAIERSQTLFVAAMNGAAFGGGTELALACDLRVGGPSTELALTEVKLGIIPGGGGTQRLTRLVGPGRAKDLILTGRKIGADEAFSIGILNRLAPAGQLLQTAVALAQSVVENAPVAVGAAKHAIDEGLSLDLDAGLELELAKYELVLKSEDRLEGLRAFAEKRPPVFRGR